MLLALGFGPSRFFLKGKVRQKKQATYINTQKEGKLVRCEMNTKEEDIKKKAESGTVPGTGQRD